MFGIFTTGVLFHFNGATRWETTRTQNIFQQEINSD